MRTFLTSYTLIKSIPEWLDMRDMLTVSIDNYKIVSHFELLDAYPEPLVYELPAHARSEKTGRGQVQYWFLFRFRGSNDALELKKGGEFRSWKWTSFDELI